MPWALVQAQALQLSTSPDQLLEKPLCTLPEDELLQGFAPFAKAYQASAPPLRTQSAQPAQVRLRPLTVTPQGHALVYVRTDFNATFDFSRTRK